MPPPWTSLLNHPQEDEIATTVLTGGLTAYMPIVLMRDEAAFARYYSYEQASEGELRAWADAFLHVLKKVRCQETEGYACGQVVSLQSASQPCGKGQQAQSNLLRQPLPLSPTLTPRTLPLHGVLRHKKRLTLGDLRGRRLQAPRHQEPRAHRKGGAVEADLPSRTVCVRAQAPAGGLPERMAHGRRVLRVRFCIARACWCAWDGQGWTCAGMCSTVAAQSHSMHASTRKRTCLRTLDHVPDHAHAGTARCRRPTPMPRCALCCTSSSCCTRRTSGTGVTSPKARAYACAGMRG